MRRVVTGLLLLLGACVLRRDPNPFADLGQGDVTGVVVGVLPGTASTENSPLPGCRVRVGQSPFVASARADGRFFLRNLPEGTHRINLFYDPDHDGVVNLAAAVNFPIRIPPLRAARTSVDVGTVVLLPPGTIRGTVAVEGIPVGDPRLAQVRVAVTQADVHAMVDAATGAFELTGLGEGTWTVVAGYRNLLGGPLQVEVVHGETTTLGDPLALTLQDGVGVVAGRLVGPRGTNQSVVDVITQGLDSNVQLALIPADRALAAEPPTTLTPPPGGGHLFPFRTLTRAGLYTLEILPPSDVALPLRVDNVLVLAGTELDLGDLPVALPPSGECVDMDGDGACALGAVDAGPCAATCADPTHDVDQPCDDGVRWRDCDDDGDGEKDLEEALGPSVVPPGGVPGPCRCGITGPLGLDTPTCEGDPGRADRDFDGVCDLFDPFPGCTLNRSPCRPDGAELPGLPTVFIPATVVGTPVPGALSLAQMRAAGTGLAGLAVVRQQVHFGGTACADVVPDAVDGGFQQPGAVVVARYAADGTCTQRNTLGSILPTSLDFRMAVAPNGHVVVAGQAPSLLRLDGNPLDAGITSAGTNPLVVVDLPPTGGGVATWQFVQQDHGSGPWLGEPVLRDLVVTSTGEVVLLLEVDLQPGQSLAVGSTPVVSIDGEMTGLVVLPLAAGLRPSGAFRAFHLGAEGRGLEASLEALANGGVQLTAEVFSQVTEPNAFPAPVTLTTTRLVATSAPGAMDTLQEAAVRPAQSRRTTGLATLASSPQHQLLRLRTRDLFDTADTHESTDEPPLEVRYGADAGVALLAPYTVVDLRQSDGGVSSWTALQGSNFQQPVPVVGAILRHGILDNAGGAVVAGSFGRQLSARDSAGRGVLLDGVSDASHGVVARLAPNGTQVATRLAVPQDLTSAAAVGGVVELADHRLAAWGAFSGTVAFGQHPRCVAVRSAGRTLTHLGHGSVGAPMDALPFVWLLRPEDLADDSACLLQPAAAGPDPEGSLRSPVDVGTSAQLHTPKVVTMDLVPYGDEDCVTFSTATTACEQLEATIRLDSGACTPDTNLRLLRQSPDGELTFQARTLSFSLTDACNRGVWRLAANAQHTLCVRGFAGQQVRGVQLGLQVTTLAACP